MKKLRIEFEFKRALSGFRGEVRGQLAKLGIIVIARRVYSRDGFLCIMPSSDLEVAFSLALSVDRYH